MVHPRLGRKPPENIESRLIIYDANGEKLFGPLMPPEGALPRAPVKREIKVNGDVIGALAAVPRGRTPNGVDARFLRNQYLTGGAIALLLVVFSLLPA